MMLQMVGCSHHNTAAAVRERLAFSENQARDALAQWHTQFPETEAVLLSTCNRTEMYAAAQDPRLGPSRDDIAEFLCRFHDVPLCELSDDLQEQSDEGAVRHLFTVAASLDSMVVGEGQILAQVKAAYELANAQRSTGPILHDVFQAALRVARRVASETSINARRVSIPSIAVADFAAEIFERFDDKNILVIGAGEMGEETLRYLADEGARRPVVINRSPERAAELASRWKGRAQDWSTLAEAIVAADLVISTTGATEPIFTVEHYRRIESHRYQRPLFILDLAIPRDFDPAIGDCMGVYLYGIDDLRAACDRNRAERAKEWPAAERIVDEETARFMQALRHRATAPTIRLLKEGYDAVKEQELLRLLNKLQTADERDREEIRRAFDRLVNKLLHPPMESLRDESEHGTPHGLIDALKRLFQLRD